MLNVSYAEYKTREVKIKERGCERIIARINKLDTEKKSIDLMWSGIVM